MLAYAATSHFSLHTQVRWVVPAYMLHSLSGYLTAASIAVLFVLWQLVQTLQLCKRGTCNQVTVHDAAEAANPSFLVAK